MSEKIQNNDFKMDISNLLAVEQEWSFDDAHEMVQDKLISLLPGEPLKSRRIK